MDLFKSAKIRVLQAWSTGVTSGVSGLIDTQGIENLTLICAGGRIRPPLRKSRLSLVLTIEK